MSSKKFNNYMGINMEDDIKNVCSSAENMFNNYMDRAYAGIDIPEMQYIELKLAFYGALSSIFLLFNNTKYIEDKYFFEIFKKINEEVENFWEKHCGIKDDLHKIN